jgi:hypothetical protein
MRRTRSPNTVPYRLTALCLLLAFAVAPAGAQLEWDKRNPNQTIPNPSPVVAQRDQIVAEVKRLLARDEIPVKSEGVDETSGLYTITTEPVVFARGIVARTQLGHFADIGPASSHDVIRGRVALRVEIAPSSPSTAMVGVSAIFEGLKQEAIQSWFTAPSRGLLEDKLLKHIVMNLVGTTYGDIRPDESILTPN